MSRRIATLTFSLWILLLFCGAALADAAETKLGAGFDAISTSLTRNLGKANGERGTLVVNEARFDFETRRTSESTNDALSRFEAALPRTARCLRSGSKKRPMSVCLTPRAALGFADLERALNARNFDAFGSLHAAIATSTGHGTSLLLLRSPILPIAELLRPSEALSTRTLDSVLTDLSKKDPLLVVARADERHTEPLLVVARKPLFEAREAGKPRFVRSEPGKAPWLTLRARSGLFIAARLPD